ncbi:MAG: insulinase family protein [Elusimicrobia bacterium]|nr:insulinase family protein [Elusimicrobiota bacterium]
MTGPPARLRTLLGAACLFGAGFAAPGLSAQGLSSQGVAAQAAAAGPAEPATGPRVPKVAFETAVLANGLRVVVAADASVPVVTVAMAFNAGGRTEPRGRAGFAHLFEHLMFEGSKHVRKGQFDRILESYGGDNNALSHEDYTIFYEVLPSNALAVALWLDADRLADLDVTKDAIRNQIEVVKEERRMRVDNDPYGPLLYVDVASRTFSNWQNAHPTIGSYEDFAAATTKAVSEFYADYYSPQNGVLAIVGDVDPARALSLVKDYFEWIPNRGSPAAVDVTEPEPASARWFELADTHAHLPALAVAWKGLPARGSPDHYALALVGQALFAGKNSRLYQELVKRAQVAVSLEGGLGFPLMEPREYKEPGSLGGYVVHKAEHSARDVQGLLMKQVSKVAAAGLGPAELDRVKTKFRSDWVRSRETTLGRAQMLLTAAILDGDPGTVNMDLERFMAVTPEDTRRAAARFLRPDAAAFFAVSPGGRPLSSSDRGGTPSPGTPGSGRP